MSDQLNPNKSIEIRAAVDPDASHIQKLLEPFVEQRKILRRTSTELRSLMKNGFVAVDTDIAEENRIVGYAAIEIYSRKLGEIQCLTVADTHQHRGIGSRLVTACVGRATALGVMEIMAISSSESFLNKLGFDYSLPDQKRALFLQLRSREDVYNELSQDELSQDELSQDELSNE